METYHCSKKYYNGENANHAHPLRENGRINFAAPPKGYQYAAMVITKEQIKEWHLDPMFVTMHMFGTKRKLCYMVLTSSAIKHCVEQPEKNEDTRARRYKRCQIFNAKTGNWIMCPYDGQHKCSECPVKAEDKHEIVRAISLDAFLASKDDENKYSFEIADKNVNIEEAFIEMDIRECIRKELENLDSRKRQKNQRAMNLQIYDLWTQNYSSAEIARMLNIKKATLHDDLVRIANIVKKYM